MLPSPSSSLLSTSPAWLLVYSSGLPLFWAVSWPSRADSLFRQSGFGGRAPFPLPSLPLPSARLCLPLSAPVAASALHRSPAGGCLAPWRLAGRLPLSAGRGPPGAGSASCAHETGGQHCGREGQPAEQQGGAAAGAPGAGGRSGQTRHPSGRHPLCYTFRVSHASLFPSRVCLLALQLLPSPLSCRLCVCLCFPCAPLLSALVGPLCCRCC